MVTLKLKISKTIKNVCHNLNSKAKAIYYYGFASLKKRFQEKKKCRIKSIKFYLKFDFAFY